MFRILYTPTKYVQGPGALERAGELLAGRCESCFAVLDPGVEGLLREKLGADFDSSVHAGAPALDMAVALGECCEEEVERLAGLAGQTGERRMVLAAGGGKTVDIGKAVAAKIGAQSVIVPTIAASDAPTSSIAIMYTSEHVYKGAVRFADNPHMILVDTEIICKAPARFLAAGMGDALATKIEAEGCMAGGGKNLHAFTGTLAALHLARSAYEIILEQGLEAMRDVAARKSGPAFEAVVEANILMSGLGWENCGLTIPHAFHGALTGIAKFDRAMHGERVALGLLAQLHYDGNSAELERLRAFYAGVGLPLRFADLSGNAPVSEEDLDAVMLVMARPGSYARNLPGGLDEERLRASLRAFI